jgi:hypothetical protein
VADHLPPTWFSVPGRGQVWHFGPVRPNQGRVGVCGIGLIAGFKVAREPRDGRICKRCEAAVNVLGPWLRDDDDLSAVEFVEVRRG